MEHRDTSWNVFRRYTYYAGYVDRNLREIEDDIRVVRMPVYFN